MHSFFTFLTTPTADTAGTTLLLHFDSKRYLFGSLAEGTQRACVQVGSKLQKVSEMFITGRTEWGNVGGMIGVVLTMADIAQASAATSEAAITKTVLKKLKREQSGSMDAPSDEEVAGRVARETKKRSGLRIFGPPNLNHLLAASRHFVFRKGTPLDVREFSARHATTGAGGASDIRPVFVDENISVWALPVTPANAGDSSVRPAAGSVSPRKRSFDELNNSEAGEESTLSTEDQNALMTKSIVADMFGSTWRLDALVESSIHDVKMPASLFVRDPVTGKTIEYTGPLPGGAEPVPEIQVLVRQPWPGSKVAALPPTEPAKESMSYIVKNHRQRGKFRPADAIKLEVERGIGWSRLVAGESVKNKHGAIITPDMVLGKGKDGGGTAIVDLPSNDYVETLINRPEWSVKEIMSGVGAFVWMLGPGVAANPSLKQFMTRMSDYKHVISSSDLCPNELSMTSAAAATVKLMKVDPARYSIPVHSNTKPLGDAGANHTGAVLARRKMVLQLEPKVDVLSNQIEPPLDLDKVLGELPSNVVEASEKSLADIRSSAAELEAWASDIPSKDAEIITLGTGSALPSKYRNVSATLVRVPGWGSILLDCGENTLGQLRRMYGESEFKEVMHDLRIIWISHMHADHHLGTASVIKAWYQTVHNAQPEPGPAPHLTPANIDDLIWGEKRLAIVSEPNMVKWLWEYNNVEDIGYSRLAPLSIKYVYPEGNFNVGPPGPLTVLNWFRASGNMPIPASSIGLSDIQTCQVTHCQAARAVAMTLPSGFKVSYSGDCRPSKAFVDIGKGSTVCIHEATFDDELIGDAKAKRHTTTSEALGVALAMGAKACVLTHFSQRYQKVPVLEYTDDEDAVATPAAPTADDAEVTDAADHDDAAPMEIGDGFTANSRDAEPEGTGVETRSTGVETRIKLKKGTDMKVCVAFDLMKVKVGEIAQMEKMTPALIKLFAATAESDGEAKEASENGDGAEKKDEAPKKEKKDEAPKKEKKDETPKKEKKDETPKKEKKEKKSKSQRNN